MLKKTGLPVSLQKLPTSPGLPEIHHYLSLALERRGKHVQISWTTADKQMEFILDIISPIKGGDPNWKLQSQHGKKRSLVFDYTSCDVLLVYNLVVSSCGQVHEAVQADGQLTVSDFQREASRKSEKFYMMSIDQSHKEYQSGNSTKDNAWSRASVPVSGDIAHVAVPQLLQSFVSGKSTGKLEVRSSQGTANLYLADGYPVHATASDAVGDDAIIELMTWKDGQFAFEPRVRTDVQTVHQSMESLLSQGIQLADRISFLRNAGMRTTSRLMAKNPGMSDLDFVQRVARGAPTDVGMLGKFFRSLNGRLTLDEMIHEMGLSRNQLVHMIYHLMVNELIQLTNEAKPKQTSPVEPRQINTTAIHGVMMSLRRAETGMFIYPAFLYFLEQEYFRSYRSGSPLSVVVFEMRTLSHVGNDQVRQVLPNPALLDAVGRISQLKRHVDVLAHYDAFDYALLLPNTKAAGAHIFAQRIVKSLNAQPLGGMVEANRLCLSFGTASIPEDFLDLSLLLGAADAAMNRARQQKQPVVAYKDMKGRDI